MTRLALAALCLSLAVPVALVAVAVYLDGMEGRR